MKKEKKFKSKGINKICKTCVKTCKYDLAYGVLLVCPFIKYKKK